MAPTISTKEQKGPKMKKLIPEMKHKPYGEDHMVDAFLGLVFFAVSIAQITNKFKDETGIDILDVIRAKGINEMIDKASGRQKDAIVKWLDWIAENLWGLE